MSVNITDLRDMQQMLFASYFGNGVTAMENDGSGKVIYIGYASAGTGKAEAKWQIRKITYDSNGFVTDIQFANGTAEFDKVWNNRSTAYTYS